MQSAQPELTGPPMPGPEDSFILIKLDPATGQATILTSPDLEIGANGLKVIGIFSQLVTMVAHSLVEKAKSRIVQPQMIIRGNGKR